MFVALPDPPRQPLSPLCLMLSTSKASEDFAYLAHKVKSLIGGRDDDYVFAIVSDSDAAQEKGLRQCSLFKEHLTVFLKGELHLRDDIDKKLKTLKFSEETRETIIRQIFGQEVADQVGCFSFSVQTY